MTWTPRIVDSAGDDIDCGACKHISFCNIHKITSSLATVMTSVDTCSDGHMASGESKHECYGFESVEVDPAAA